MKSLMLPKSLAISLMFICTSQGVASMTEDPFPLYANVQKNGLTWTGQTEGESKLENPLGHTVEIYVPGVLNPAETTESSMTITPEQLDGADVGDTRLWVRIVGLKAQL